MHVYFPAARNKSSPQPTQAGIMFKFDDDIANVKTSLICTKTSNISSVVRQWVKINKTIANRPKRRSKICMTGGVVHACSPVQPLHSRRMFVQSALHASSARALTRLTRCIIECQGDCINYW